jgi:HD superfamily phosphodiesterase
MADHSDIVQRASEHIFELFKQKLPEHLVYHNYAHTESVALAARKLAKGMELGEEAIEIVTLAGWFHDAGFIEAYHGHEDVSKRIAEEYLRGEGASDEKIGYILGCIEATRMPQRPKNLLEEILCDADMSALGKKTSFERSQLLRIEWEKALGKTMTDEEWLRQDLNFLTSHKYFTRYAQEIYDDRKLENIRERDKQLRKLIKANEEAKHEEEIVSKLSTSMTENLPPNIQPVDISTSMYEDQIARVDRKAGMMLLVNSFIITIISSLLILNRDMTLGIPGILILSLFTIALILSVNALMQGMSKSKYSLEVVIGKKNEYLRLSYLFFLAAVIVSVALFILASLSYRGGGGVGIE